ncbi:MAG: shikimate kinase, partial [Desulfobulbia bacterium]
LIESRTNKKIKKIFKQDGEAAFRELERKTAVWLEESVTNSVISTGGGFVNVPNINRTGTVVYLHSGFDTIINSITNHPNAEKKINKRPLLADLDKAEHLYQQRLPIYRMISDIEIDVTGKSSEEVVELILSLLKESDR